MSLRLTLCHKSLPFTSKPAPKRRPTLSWLWAPVLGLALSGCSEPPESGQQADKPLTEEALIAQGRQKARICTGCHGSNGVSRIPSYPSLAGLSQTYLAEQLQAFRSGERDNATMSSIAMNLDDNDIDALSHYFASLPEPNKQ